MKTTRQTRSLKDTQEMPGVTMKCIARAGVAKPAYTDRYGVGPSAVTGVYAAIVTTEKE